MLLINPYVVDTIIVSILQKSTLRLREGDACALTG